jgi:hypothetical protein
MLLAGIPTYVRCGSKATFRVRPPRKADARQSVDVGCVPITDMPSLVPPSPHCHPTITTAPKINYDDRSTGGTLEWLLHHPYTIHTDGIWMVQNGL